jgi:hypothetical protein
LKIFALENKNHPTPMKIKHVALSLALMATGIASANADRLVIKGSDTLGAKLVPQLAEQFKAQHPGTTFDIAAWHRTNRHVQPAGQKLRSRRRCVKGKEHEANDRSF